MVSSCKSAAMKNPAKRILAFTFVCIFWRGSSRAEPRRHRRHAVARGDDEPWVARASAWRSRRRMTLARQIGKSIPARSASRRIFSPTFPQWLDDEFPKFLEFRLGHAGGVAGYFYGIPGGVATNVAHVDNYDVNDFVQVNEFVTNSTGLDEKSYLKWGLKKHQTIFCLG